VHRLSQAQCRKLVERKAPGLPSEPKLLPQAVPNDFSDYSSGNNIRAEGMAARGMLRDGSVPIHWRCLTDLPAALPFPLHHRVVLQARSMRAPDCRCQSDMSSRDPRKAMIMGPRDADGVGRRCNCWHANTDRYADCVLTGSN